MTTRIKLRRDTAANWNAADPVLALGEPGYDTTNNKIKVGNGTSTWTQLSYLTDATGNDIPAGGTTGQVLAKASGTNYDTEWVDQTGGDGGEFNGTATAIELTGTIPYTNDNVLSTVVDFTRPNNSNNTVDAIDTGLTIKRGNNGGIYNSANNVETNWDSDQSPLGTEWNADGWGDLTDVQTRTYTTFYEACDQAIGSVVTHKQFVMHDTINDKYYKIKFHFWQPNNGGGAAQSLDERSGFSYTRTLLDLSNGVYFVRGADDTNLGDEIGPGLTIKRGEAGGIYNSEEEAEWDPDNTPTGTLWNDDGWDDFTDITTRTWKPLYSAVHGQLGNHLVGAELLMHDTINDQYYTVKFTDWGQNNGGSFAYLRREINPTGTRLGITFADGSVQKTATTLGDLRVVNGNVFENAVQPGHGAEIRYDVKNNFYYGTWAWTGTANWVASGNDGYIQFDNDDANNGNQVDFRQFLNDLGRWQSKTVSINGGDPQTITNWSNNYIYTEDAPATDPTEVTEIRFYVTFRSRFYMGGENTVGFFLNDRDESFEVQARDINLYGDDDVRIRGKDLVEIRNNGTSAENHYIQIVTDGSDTSKTWRFMPDGSIQLPNMDNTGWNYSYNLNGPTLKLGNNQDQTIITGATPTQNYPGAQRLIIQGQRGYGTWGQNISGEGGDVYIWGGVGGESDGGGGSGGDIKIRGGQGQNAEGGYVRIEGGSAAGWNTDATGGFVEINGGDAVQGGNGDGADVRIRGGKKNGTGNNGKVFIRTGSNEEFEWQFGNDGTLTLPSSSTIKEVAAPIVGNAILLTPSGGNESSQALKIYPTELGDGDHVHLTANGGNTELYLGDDNHYVKLVNGGNVEIRSDDMAGNTAVWSFGTDGNLTVPGNITMGPGSGRLLSVVTPEPGLVSWEFGMDGTTTLPGAVVNSTVAKTATPNTGIPLTLGDSTWGVALGDGSYGPFTGSIVGIVYNVVVTGGTAAYTIVSYPGTIAVNTVIDQLDAGSLGGTPGNTSNISVTTVNDAMALDLNKSINKLADGSYTLADGVEGQIMYLVPQSGITPANVSVDVGNYRVGGFNGTNGGLYPFRILNDADATYYDSRAFCTLIFTDGAWEQSGGSWD